MSIDIIIQKLNDAKMFDISKSLATIVKANDSNSDFTDKEIDNIIKEISELTEVNDTNGSWIVVCDKILKNKALSKAFESIDRLHVGYWGHLTPGVKAARQELIDEATRYAKQKLGNETWKKIYKAF